MTDLPPAGYLSNASRDVGEMKQALEDIVAVIREIIGGNAEELRTISNGVITPTRASVVVDTESGAAADDLDQISTANLPDGRTILIRSADASRVVTVRHAQGGAGQIHLVDNANLALSSPTQWLWLIRRGNDWHEIMRFYGNNKAAALAFFGAITSARKIQTGAGLAGGGDLSADRTLSVIVPLGQCRLTLDSGNLKLSRYNGRFLFIGGALHEIPAEGVTLPPTGLSANTTYYIYAWMDSGVMKLEASTTPPTVAMPYGNMVKAVAGGEQYSLVGMARVVAGPAFADSDAQRLVASYFNRRLRRGRREHAGEISVGAGPVVELSSALRCEFLVWGDEDVFWSTNAEAFGVASGHDTSSYGAFDGVAEPEFGRNVVTVASLINYSGHASLSSVKTGLAEGYHYFTMFGGVETGTGRWRSITTTIATRI